MVRRGRRFEPVRGLCKSPVNRCFCVQIDLLLVECAVSMEPFMELSVSERLRDRVSSGNMSAGDPSGRRASTSGLRCVHSLGRCQSHGRKGLKLVDAEEVCFEGCASELDQWRWWVKTITA
jgi:hypothetical protein